MSQEFDGLEVMARAASDMLDWLPNYSTVRGGLFGVSSSVHALLLLLEQSRLRNETSETAETRALACCLPRGDGVQRHLINITNQLFRKGVQGGNGKGKSW